MGSGAIKWHVHCSVCGAFIEKSAQSDSEVECRKCRSTLEILVKDDMVSVRPLIVRDEQLKSRMRSYSQMMMNPGKDNKEKEQNELFEEGGEFGRNHQGRTGQQEFVKELNLTGITKSPAKHLRIHCKIRSIFWFWRLLKYLFCRAFLMYFKKFLNFLSYPTVKQALSVSLYEGFAQNTFMYLEK